MWGLDVSGFHLPAWPIWIGYAAAATTLVTFSMRTMIPLRATGILANVLFIIYGFFGGFYPPLVLHVILLPLNSVRLYQMLQLVRKVREASRGDLSMDWLKPFMSRRQCRKGEVLFRRGDISTEMFYTVSGRFRLVEAAIEIPVGQTIGELGLIAPENRRTQTFECLEDGELLTIGYGSVEQIYFQNPNSDSTSCDWQPSGYSRMSRGSKINWRKRAVWGPPASPPAEVCCGSNPEKLKVRISRPRCAQERTGRGVGLRIGTLCVSRAPRAIAASRSRLELRIRSRDDRSRAA